MIKIPAIEVLVDLVPAEVVLALMEAALVPTVPVLMVPTQEATEITLALMDLVITEIIPAPMAPIIAAIMETMASIPALMVPITMARPHRFL